MRRARGGRRGTVLLLALGVLGILSIAAISYVTIVRVDRSSAEAGARRTLYQQQPDAVIEHLGALIGADLWGNKVVTGQVPPEAWPAMFEDGDARDLPIVDLARSTFNTGDPGETPSNNSILPFNDNIAAPAQRKVGYPDDAWLASTEPLWDPAQGEPRDTKRWPQITNLRSAYLWDASSPSQRRWVRGDGRFVDIGQWFLKAAQPSPGLLVPNPGVELMRWNGGDAVTSEGRLGPVMGVDQDVFQYQVNTMARRVDPRDDATPASGEIDPLTPRDERQWVDTDGDLRPDARWQQIDALGSLGGLNWFVAARIIDASALVNVNAALEFGSPADSNPLATFADGRTPADVDLYRLLVGAAYDRVYERRVVSQGVDQSFAEAFSADINMFGVFTDAARLDPQRFGMIDDGIDPTQSPWEFNQRFTRERREAFWRYFGSSPQRPATRHGTPIPIRDLVDLNAFWATNHADLLSEVELRFDGPAVDGYLPGREGTTDLGPMRSRELPRESRAFAPGSNPAPENQLPTADQIRKSLRRLLTPVSGEAPFSPVPVLNTGPSTVGATSPFQGVSWREKIPLDKPLSDEGVQRAFEAFVWALAPFATNLPLSKDLADNNLWGENTRFGGGLANAANLHYGGGIGGPARALGRLERFSPRPASPSPLADDASFAAATAASLAVNLRDALDADAVPSVARFFGKPNTTEQRDLIDPGARAPIILDSSFAQGGIEETNLSAIGAQQPGSFQDAGGMTIVGLERQPYLSEVTTFVVYSDYSGDSNAGGFAGGNNNHIVGDFQQEVFGSGIVVELANPWSTPITLDGGTQGGYSIVIPESKDSMGANSFVLSLPNSFVIPPGARPRFYWVLKKDFGRWDNVRDEIIDHEIFSGGVELLDPAIFPQPDTVSLRVPFRDMLDQSLPVLLVYDRRQTETPLFPGYVIDRMAPDEETLFPVGAGTGGFDLTTAKADNVPGAAPSFTFAGYFQTLGYSDVAPVNAASTAVNAGLMTGRMLVTSSLSRTHAQSSAAPPAARVGFPGYVLEVPNANHVFVRHDAHAWLEPPVNPEPPVISRVTPADIIRDGPLFPVNFPADHSDLGSVAKRADFGGVNPGAIAPQSFQGFQLYVPGASPPRLNALSELHMLSCYANTCRTRTPTPPRSWDVELADLINWQTVGEKMGLSIRRDFDVVESWYNNHAPGAGFPFDQADANPYIGTLDPTRFILNDPNSAMASANGLPDTMAIPLALRVFDCFRPMSTPSFLAQGKININTAPREVLAALPLVAPEFPIMAGTTSLTQTTDRLDDMILYRDAERQEGFISGTVRIDGLRRRASGPAPRPAGFISTGELAILDRWEPSTPGVVVDGAPSWLRFADRNNASGEDGAPWEMVTDYADPSFNPINDVEERLALYRAVSNIVTTRSDVFLAWFVVRGYEPATIEQIPIRGTSQTKRLEAMDDRAVPLKPAFDSRWLVVFDRSNVRRPTDRPEVLLKVELPRAEP